MRNISTEIEIEASVGKVWKVLTDFDNYPKWNPYIQHVDGRRKLGKRLKISLHKNKRELEKISVKIIALDENEKFAWQQKSFFRGKFVSEHYFQLIPLNDKKTSLIHGENLSGFFVLLKNLRATKKDFQAMNEALKTECER